MPDYFWRGVDIHGSPGEGALETYNRNTGRERLYSEGMFRVRMWKIPRYRQNAQIGLEELVSFLVQLQRMQKSGFEVYDAMDFIIREQEDPVLAFVLCRVRDDMREGVSLSAALLRQKQFPVLLGKLIRVSETSGQMREGVNLLLEYFQSQLKVRREQQRMLNYPLVVSGLFLLLSLGMLWYVVPMFQRMYGVLGQDLFWLTRGMVILSNSMHEYPWRWLLGCLSAAGLILFNSRLFGWRWLLAFLPGIRNLEQSVRMLFYARSLEIMLRSGVRLREALMHGESLFPQHLRKQVQKVREMVDAGRPLPDAFAAYPGFPPFFLRQLSLGESSGHLVSGFARISSHFEDLLEKRMSRLNALIEPLFMVFIAMAVLAFLLSLYLPLFRMAEHF